ncbi:cation diffusion facilitator family transporter [Pseudonocardia spinosispora]|uniref:cation diffusion facilitator family transporter n=1 Tax=Pseudonocardia spinosispora TaxID=103441 RepID=UPI00041A50F9|nr:cation diffusion facilitator family transporter [Pseudonocardia spinosispora]
MTDETKQSKDSGEHGESLLTVLLALGANFAVAIAKVVAGLVTGSAALLSESAHSFADCGTELFLLTALRRSSKPADSSHPFGYGKERYFWSLLAAVSIFTAGALFSLYQGIHTLTGHPEDHKNVLVGYGVLAVSAVLESISLAQAIKQVRNEQAKEKLPLLPYLRGTDDPTVKTVLYEDSAALLGLFFAFGGIGLTQLTGSSVWDGIASLLIALLLMVVAYLLGRTNMSLLTGQQADHRLVSSIRDRLESAPEVEVVVDLLTMMTGTDQVLVCARLDFADDVTSDQLERACVRIDAELREEFTDLDEIFLEPVPRNDPELRAKVRARYGVSPEEIPNGLTPVAGVASAAETRPM